MAKPRAEKLNQKPLKDALEFKKGERIKKSRVGKSVEQSIKTPSIKTKKRMG
jgi:hypothetical protein